MKVLVYFLILLLAAGCNLGPDDPMNDAAVKVSGIFIADNIQSDPSYRIKQSKVVKNGSDSIYHISGVVEGYTSFNVPVKVEHFTETVSYLGGDKDDRKNWKCVEIYIGNRKM